MTDWIQSLDWSCLGWIQDNLRCGFLDFVMPGITSLGNYGIFWILTAVALLFTKKFRKCGIMMLVGLIIGVLIGNLCLKPLIARDRPCWLDPSVQTLIPIETDFSFPSGHTLASVISAVVLTLNDRRFALAAIPLAVLIAFSRLYLYMHFPTDVFAAIILGIVIAFAAYWIVNKLCPLLADKLRKRRGSGEG